MQYPEDTDTTDKTDITEDQPLVFDGTANLDYPDDERVPRVKGLIELLNQYFGRKKNQRNDDS